MSDHDVYLFKSCVLYAAGQLVCRIRKREKAFSHWLEFIQDRPQPALKAFFKTFG